MIARAILAAVSQTAPLDTFVPESLRDLTDPARDLPRLAKSRSPMAAIEAAVVEVPTRHQLLLGDARLAALPAESVHLVVTSPALLGPQGVPPGRWPVRVDRGL